MIASKAMSVSVPTSSDKPHRHAGDQGPNCGVTDGSRELYVSQSVGLVLSRAGRLDRRRTWLRPPDFAAATAARTVGSLSAASARALMVTAGVRTRVPSGNSSTMYRS